MLVLGEILTKYRSIFLVFTLLATLTSCGFHPVLSSGGDACTRELLGQIELSSMQSIEGADFYNRLKNILPYGREKKYLLKTTLSFSKDFSIIQKNSDILREMVAARVSYSLRDKETGKIRISGSFSRLSSFNTTFSPYSNQVQQYNVQKNLAIMSAEEVRNRIMLFLERENKEK